MQSSEQLEVRQNKQQVLDQQAADLLRLHESPFVRALYLGVGFLALFLGALGAFLPILPTTPFILLAAACFARGSERFHRKLLANRIAGPIILEWRIHRSIPRPVKRWVYLLMALSFGSSILIVPELWQKLMLVVIGSILVFFIWRVPVRDTLNR
ncbi:YbaN family protein [Nitrosomonas sp. Nm166]|uniref:YbaN family protein n=1 Tax=Nitrosomonas sp. Nm166 TaxID=1881054 RepID=UPI0008E67094|nr:YbaN family protein [Nitrosomonas sp. Nm166]SFE90379.1 hypothetical protein SAMN05428977_103524 [Nitrosomonas sp. Nm166]